MRGITKAVLGLVGVAALVGGALIADDVARDRVEARSLAEIEAALPGLVDADVQVAGTFVVPQLAVGRLDGVTATAAAVTVSGTTLTGLTAEVRGVDLDRLVADRVEVTGTVAAAELEDRLPPGLGLQIDGGEVVLETSVLGLPVSIPVDLAIRDGDALVTVRAVSLAGLEVTVGELPDVVADALADLRLELPRVAGVEVTDVEVRPEGLRLTAVGTEVSLRAAAGG